MTGRLRGYAVGTLMGLIVSHLFIGCGKTPQTQDIEGLESNDAIASADSYRISAAGDIKAAQPHTNKIGKPLLIRATGNLDAQGDELAKARRTIAANRKGWAVTVGERNKAQKDTADVLRRLAANEASYFSMRQQNQWFWFKVTIAALLAGWLVAGIAGVFIKGAAGRWILNFLPVSNVFTYFARKRWGDSTDA